jgi:hypothetical protein
VGHWLSTATVPGGQPAPRATVGRDHVSLAQQLINILTRPAKAAHRAASHVRGLAQPREHRSALEKAAVISLLAIIMGALFVTTYTLALGDPVPHYIDAGLVGDPAGQAGTVDAAQRVAAWTSTAMPRSRPRCTPSTSRTSTPPSI